MVNCQNKHSSKIELSEKAFFFFFQFNGTGFIQQDLYSRIIGQDFPVFLQGKKSRCKFELIIRIILMPNRIYFKAYWILITQLFLFL